MDDGANHRPHAVLATLSGSYSPLPGRSPTRYSAVRHLVDRASPINPVRLACLTHPASVCPEPGSNSPNKKKTVALPRGSSTVRSSDLVPLTRVGSCHSSAVKVAPPLGGFVRLRPPILGEPRRTSGAVQVDRRSCIACRHAAGANSESIRAPAWCQASVKPLAG